MRMNAQDQTPVSLGTFGRCVVCPVGAPAYRNKSTQTPLFPESYRWLATAGDVPGLPEWGKGTAVCFTLPERG